MLNIAIAGLGTVGAGVVRLLRQNADLIAARAGQQIMVRAVCARDKNKQRDCDVSGIKWVDDAPQLAGLPGIDAVVELIGGADGIARDLAVTALGNGKPLITANKALIAAQGVALAKLAEQNNVPLFFEAAVAGGIPVLKALREGLAANSISAVRGILNGTCNFILTRMREDRVDFATALHEAQQNGYAEADPAADIDGFDAANKLAILAALAFGVEPDFAFVRTEGIRRITPLDLAFADELGCRVKLLGIARMGDTGLEQSVGPALVPMTSPLSQVEGALNAVQLQTSHTGHIMLQGPGAGSDATASAVVADLIDLARGNRAPAFGVPVAQLTKVNPGPAHKSRYYVRLQVMDKPGVGADIMTILRDEGLSMETILQRAQSATESVPVVLTVYEADAEAMRRALDKIARLATVVEKPCLLRIED
jgi:homoserine dehydrogenase